MLKKPVASHDIPVAKMLSLTFFTAILSLFLLLLFNTSSALADADYAWVFDPETPIWGGMDEPQNVPDIDDDRVVWRGTIMYGSAQKGRIFFKDLSDSTGSAHMLTDAIVANQSQHYAKIDGSLVAWTEGSTIDEIHYTFLEGGCPEINCTNNILTSPEARPGAISVSGNRIAWSDQRAGAHEDDIYMYDFNNPGAGEQLICSDSGEQTRPSIDGDWIAWYDESGDINVKNLITGELRTTVGYEPSISGTRMAYRQGWPINGIWLLDLSDPQSTPRQISGMVNPYHIKIDGDRIVWRNAANEIYLYDLTYDFEQQLTAGLSPVVLPAISGKRVVWADDRGGPRNIYSLYLRDLISTLGSETCCGEAGDPVNTSTGGFFYPQTDIEIATRGLPLSFVRTYNSNDDREGALGIGWSHNWQMSATTMSNGDVVILRGDGRRDVFQDNGDGNFTPPSGRYDALTVDPGNSYTLLTQDQITYNFNGDGQLTSAVAENGQVTTLSYDASGRLETITGPAGRTLTLSYTPEDRISGIAAPMDTSVTFTYSATGELITATDQEQGETTYGYDPGRKLETITSPEANATGGGPFVTNEYQDGKVVLQTDALGNMISFDYGTPYQTTITRLMDPYDLSDNQASVHYYDFAFRKTKEVDPYDKETVYTYDSAGNRDAVTDRRGAVTKQVYDPAGNPADIYRAFGAPEEQHTQATFNGENRPLTITDARGDTTSYTYDASGINLTGIDYPQVSNYDGTNSSYSESFTYNGDGTLATSIDRNGDETTYTYDANGYPDIVTVNANRPAEEQVVIDYDYDDLGRKTAQTDGEGNTTTYGYNLIGDLETVSTQVTDPDTQQPLPIVTTYTYDGNGNRTSMQDPEGRMTYYEFTARDNLRLITDDKGNTIEHEYDEAGNRTRTKDRNGNWTQFEYDLNNRLVLTRDPENNETSYTYDEEGNQTSVTDPLTHTTSYTYDAISRTTSVNEPDEGGAVRTTSYAYDPADNLLSSTDPNSHTTAYAYDELGRLRQTTEPTAQSLYYAYDGEGNTVKIKDQRGYETLYGFDASDNLTTVTDPAGGLTSYTYDSNGNRTSQTDAEGHTSLYAYDELGRITQEKVDDGQGGYLLERDYRYDRAGNITQDITGEGAISYSYDGVYNVESITDRGGGTLSYTYDANQNQLTASESGGGTTVSYTYTSRGQIETYEDAHGATESFNYDDAGNLIQRDDLAGGQNVTTSYGYTPRNQQKSVTRGADTTGFTYDPAGNLASKSYPNGLDTTYGYDEADRVTSLTTMKGAQTMNSYSQGYDQAGNLISLNDLRYGTSTFTYDELNRLTLESQAGYGDIAYTYDKVGNRTTLTTPQAAGGPDLTLSVLNVYWASPEDYENRELSIDYRTTNAGPGAAYSAEVTHSTATDGAYLITSMPMTLGDIAESSYSDHTLKYHVPEGVGSIQTTVYVKCQDQGGYYHYYPDKRDFYSYNEANQLTEVLDQDANVTTYSYDANGALTQKSMGGVLTSFSYNGMDKLTDVISPTGTVNYSYDALDRRITRSEDGYVRKLIYGAASDLYDHELNTEGALVASMLKGPDGLISLTSYVGAPITAYQNFNPHGDTTLISSPQGEEWIAARFDAFGNPLDGWELSYGYTSKWLREKDRDTMMIRMGVREYDPALGRFVSADPLRGAALNPQTRNRYEYALNNPSTYYDLDGRFPNPASAVGGWLEENWLPGAKDIGRAAEGVYNDYQEGGAGALVEDWKTGFNSMSRTQQVVLIGVPVAAGAAIVGVEAAGVGGTVISCKTIAAGASSLWGRTIARYSEKSSKAAQIGNSVASRVQFGHGARHLEGTGLTATEVETAIMQNIRLGAMNSAASGEFWGRVIIQGQTIEYRAYPVANEYINVGTYYPIK